MSSSRALRVMYWEPPKGKCSAFIGREHVSEHQAHVCATPNGICRHASIPGPQVAPHILCQVARSNLFGRHDITIGHAMMSALLTVSHPIVVELRLTATIQTELTTAKLRTLYHWQLLAQPLLDLKHRSFHASSTHSTEGTRVCTIPEEDWRSFSISLDPIH